MYFRMISTWAGNFFLITFAFIVLLLAQVSQSPQCINSKLIEKITFPDQSSIFRCENKEDVPFSKDFHRKQVLIENEILPFEKWVTLFWGPSQTNLHVQLYQKPQVTQTLNGMIKIWDKEFYSSWAFQKAVMMDVLKTQIANERLRLFVSDFYVRVWNQDQQKGYGDINSFLSHRWWLAYSKMNMQDQYVFLKQLPLHLKKNSSEILNTFDLVIQLTQLQKDLQPLPFQKLIDSQGGLQPFLLKAQFDYLILNQEINTETLKQFDLLQSRFPGKEIGVWNGESLYHVPSKSYLAAKSFQEIKAQHYIWEMCEDVQMQELFKIPAQVRKVLLVKNCAQKQAQVYGSYIRGGIETFAASQPEVHFVLLDLPSLESQKNVLKTEIKVFDLMIHQKKYADLLKDMGWQSIQHNKSLNIIKAESYVDSVESFRVF